MFEKRMSFAKNVFYTPLCTAVFVLLFFLFPKTALASSVTNVRVTNVFERSFTVSWISEANETGSVNFGATTSLGTSAADTRGSGTSSFTHYVIVGNLIPSTKYYFSIVSGNTVDDNNGSFYTVTTGPVLTVPSSDIAYGRILKNDGTAAGGVIVHLTVDDSDNQGTGGQSLPASALTNQSGGWTINLGNIRTSSLSSYFSYGPPDRLNVNALGGALGNASTVVLVSASKPVADIKLGSGSLPLATPSPTPTSPPGLTLTPTPTIVAPDGGLSDSGTLSFILAISLLFWGAGGAVFWKLPFVRKIIFERRKRGLEQKLGEVDRR